MLSHFLGTCSLVGLIYTMNILALSRYVATSINLETHNVFGDNPLDVVKPSTWVEGIISV